MKSMSKQKKTTIIVVAVVVVLLIAVLVCWAAFRPQALEGVKEITVYVYHSSDFVREGEENEEIEILDETDVLATDAEENAGNFDEEEAVNASEAEEEVEEEEEEPNIYTLEIRTTELYLIDALDPYDLLEGDESEYGLFVSSVDGEYADSMSGDYWMYNVNGEVAEYGVDSQPIADGDYYSFYIYSMADTEDTENGNEIANP